MRLPTPQDIYLAITVWESVELHTFVYRSKHADFVKRRDEWFEPVAQPTTVLWWVPVGHQPDIPRPAMLMHLRTHGPTADFYLSKRFPKP